MATDDTKITLPTGSGKEFGQSGTYLFYGYISAEEYNRDLLGKRGLEVYDTMRRSDATVHATLLVCKNPIIGATWDIEPASDEPADGEIADYIRRELFDRKIMFPELTREALTCLDFGHAVFEKVFEITEFNGAPRIGLSKVAYRKQRSILRWSTSDDKPGITQILPTSTPMIDIPRSKLVYVVNEQEGDNYEGISLLRFAYKPWKIKDSLEVMNAIALERMSLGIPIITKGENNETVDPTALKNAQLALRNIRNNEEAYLEIPASLTVTMLDMKANTTKEILPTIVYQDRQIMLSVLAQFIELGASGAGGGASGSKAVSADHSALFTKSLEAVARTIQQPFQEDIVNQLVDLNYSDLPNGYPKLVFSNIDDDDTVDTANAVSTLMTAGALTADPDMENRLRSVLNLPQLPQDIYDNYPDSRTLPGTPTDPALADPADPAAPKNDDAEEDAEDQKMPTDKKNTKKTIKSARDIQAALLNEILNG